MNKTKPPKKLPSIQDVLGVGEKQRLSYKKPEHRKGIVSLCRKRSVLSPATSELEIERITLRPFTAVPVCVHRYQEVVFFPKHGYADIFVWMRNGVKKFNLYMGCGPVVVPSGHPYAIRTFASATRIHKVTSGCKSSKTQWEEKTETLCQNKHILKPRKTT